MGRFPTLSRVATLSVREQQKHTHTVEKMEKRQINRILVANRGEIAIRIMKTCRDMGIDTVAVFSDADDQAMHVRVADLAVRIGPPPSTESYLNIDRIIQAAVETGAQAIHPGYGFLAENADFAQACDDAGIIFIGPGAEAIRAMGSKQVAKRMVSEADVPVIPGYDGADQANQVLAKKACEIGFPVLIKASAGGGGKGMRVIASEDELSEGIESARREAESAFGDGTLLIEKYLENPRHIEIQIMADSHGNTVHLFERECSIQRRHQKIIEETPSTAVDNELRLRMGNAAVQVAKATGYVNAGTVEFIFTPDGQFYFLEVNTRLQVEHPVTEMITGLDLVREQIRVARGEPLSFTQDDLTRTGAAVECRLYAEDPARDFLPATGTVLDWQIPSFENFRMDSGVEEGSVVGVHYDPLLAKLVSYGDNRDEALDRMCRALRELSVQGLTTNRLFLTKIIRHPEFIAGHIDTHFIERNRADLDTEPSETFVGLAAAATALVGVLERKPASQPIPGLATGFRNNPYCLQQVVFESESETLTVAYRDCGDSLFQVGVGELNGIVRIVDWQPPMLTLDVGDVRQSFRVVRQQQRAYVTSLDGQVTLTERPRFPAQEADAVVGGYASPMPGTVLQIRASTGDTVKKGDVLIVVESMKMESAIRANDDGVVEDVFAEEGELVDADSILIVVKPTV